LKSLTTNIVIKMPNVTRLIICSHWDNSFWSHLWLSAQNYSPLK